MGSLVVYSGTLIVLIQYGDQPSAFSMQASSARAEYTNITSNLKLIQGVQYTVQIRTYNG